MCGCVCAEHWLQSNKWLWSENIYWSGLHWKSWFIDTPGLLVGLDTTSISLWTQQWWPENGRQVYGGIMSPLLDRQTLKLHYLGWEKSNSLKSSRVQGMALLGMWTHTLSSNTAGFDHLMYSHPQNGVLTLWAFLLSFFYIPLSSELVLVSL